MSGRYEQPERGSYTDRWDIVLNRNFAEIGDDVDQLLAEKADSDGSGTATLDNYASVGTVEAHIGGTSGSAVPASARQFISNATTTVSVPGDYDTIQGAVNACPLYLRHDYTVSIDETGTYDEDVEIPPVIAADESENNRASGLELTRQGSSGRWTVNSIRVFAPIGSRAVRVSYPEITNINPTDNYHGAFINRGGSGEVQLFSPTFSNVITNSGQSDADAIISYSGHTHLAGDVDFGSDVRRGIRTVHGATVTSQADSMSGSVTEHLIAAHGSSEVRLNTVGTATSADTLVSDTHGGEATIGSEKRKYGVRSFPDAGLWTAHSDGQLDEALSLAGDGAKILLGTDNDFTTARTINKQISIEGLGTQNAHAATIAADWTWGSPVRMVNCELKGSLTVNADDCVLTQCWMSSTIPIGVNNLRFRYVNNRGGDITFASGASGGIVDSCIDTSVTDNDGGNLQGDIA